MLYLAISKKNIIGSVFRYYSPIIYTDYHLIITDLLIMVTQPEPDTPLYEQIYHYVRQIPQGSVATYGQIARLVKHCSAQMVGFALAALKEKTDVPWHRVINRFGKISPHGYGYGTAIQKNLLASENIEFGANEEIDLEKYQWIINQDM